MNLPEQKAQFRRGFCNEEIRETTLNSLARQSSRQTTNEIIPNKTVRAFLGIANRIVVANQTVDINIYQHLTFSTSESVFD